MGSTGTKYTSTTAIGVTSANTQNTIATQPPNANNTPVSPAGVTSLTSLSDDELAQLVIDSKTMSLPNQLADRSDDTQKFIFAAGINGKPQVLDSQEFNQFMRDNNIPKAEILGRSINPSQYTNQMQSNIKLTADQIGDMLKYSRFNYIGGKFGGKLYGAGTYFAATGKIGANTGYGGISNSTTINAVLNPATARIITRSSLTRSATAFANTHPKFAQAVGPFNMSKNGSIYAMAMGYNVIADNASHNTGGDYVNVIDRSALVYLK